MANHFSRFTRLALIFASQIYFFMLPSVSCAEIRNGMDADLVLGQPDFNSNASGTSQNRLNNPDMGITSANRLFVLDRGNNRILIYNNKPSTNYAPADAVMGQMDFVSGTANQGGVAAANTLNLPVCITTDQSRLIVADALNNRLLLWNQIPTSNGANADVVLGQTSFTGSGTGTSSTTLSFPTIVTTANSKLLLTDQSNQRILIWNTIPTMNATPADVVIGQTLFTTNSGGTSATKLSSPVGIVVVQDKMIVSDVANYRILIWNNIPTNSGAPADLVIGQPDLVSGGARSGPYRFTALFGLASDGKRLFGADFGNSRILVWNAIPTTNDVPPDHVIGQPDFISTSAGLSKNSLNSPVSVSHDGKRLWVGDYSNNRILAFNMSDSGSNLPPQFTQGKGVLGKVFWDMNENGVQDEGEKGIAGIKVASDTGIYAITDEDGKYHYPYIETGQRLLKIDPSTLPEGVNFTTDNPRKVTVTEGILTKVSFGVAPVVTSSNELDSRFRGDAVLRSSNDSSAHGNDSVSEDDGEPLLKVSVSQDPLDVSKTLSITHAWTDDTTLDFKITCNYRLFVSSAEILLYDKTHNLIQTIALPHPLPYKHTLDLNQEGIDPKKVHAYQIKVYDKDGASDATSLGLA